GPKLKPLSVRGAAFPSYSFHKILETSAIVPVFSRSILMLPFRFVRGALRSLQSPNEWSDRNPTAWSLPIEVVRAVEDRFPHKADRNFRFVKPLMELRQQVPPPERHLGVRSSLHYTVWLTRIAQQVSIF